MQHLLYIREHPALSPCKTQFVTGNLPGGIVSKISNCDYSISFHRKLSIITNVNLGIPWLLRTLCGFKCSPIAHMLDH